MNKLISSTFCTALLSIPLFFQQMEKKPGNRREGFSVSEAKKPLYTLLRILHYSNQEFSPAIMPSKHPCHLRASITCTTVVVIVLQQLKNVIADNQEAILRS